MTAVETHYASRVGYPPMMRYTFVIGSATTATRQVYDVATCGDLHARSLRSCAARKLARQMIEAGYPDGPIEVYGQTGVCRYTVRSLYAFARVTLSEDPSIHKSRWTPHPYSVAGHAAQEASGGAEGG